MAVSLSSPLIWAISIIVLLPSITILGGGVNDPYGMNNGYEPVVTGPLLTRETREYINFEDEPPTRIAGGQMEWAIPLLNAGGQPLSTPSLSDLDLDGTLEIVVASASDQVFALTPNGSYFWDTPYQDDVIDYLGQTSVTTGLDFEPPPFFTSVTSKDITLGDTPEVYLGVLNGVLWLGSDGEKKGKTGLTTGYYLPTPCLTDLEGEWSGNKEDLEIVLASIDISSVGWLDAFCFECGAMRFPIREELIMSNRTPIMGSSLVASDLDGRPVKGPYAKPPGPEDELDSELVACYPGVPLSIFVRNGTSYEGYPNYDQKIIVKDPVILVFGTPAVGNISGGPECEIIVPYCKGYGNWTDWIGGIKAYGFDGIPLWDFPLQDKGTGVCTSPAIAFMDQGKELPKKKVIVFGSDNGFVYAIDAETHSLMWQFDTGGRVLSSPAICNIDNDDELEMVIGSDFGMVYCFDLDPSDGVDEGISYPGDGPLQDVLWVYGASAPIGISSPVIADIDLDKQLEVVIGDFQGTLYCISAGGKSLIGQIDWPEFHNDHNRTGIYDPKIAYGVEIYAKKYTDGIPEWMKCRIDPGKTKTYNMTVENTGRGITTANKDRISVSIEPTSVRPGWSAWLDTPPLDGNDNPGYVRLASGETANLTLYVYAPLEGDIGEMARINVTAVSFSDPRAQDQLTTFSILNLFLDFDIYFNKLPSTDPLDPFVGQKWEKIYPGDEREFQITVSNKGNLNDSYKLVLSPPPMEVGWNWSFSDTGTLNRQVYLNAQRNVQLWGGVSTESINVIIKAPSEYFGPSIIPLELKATSQLSLTTQMETLVKKDAMVLKFVGQSLLDLRFSDDPFYIMPGERTDVTLSMRNIGPTGQVRVNLSHAPITNWTIEHGSGPFIVEDNGTEEVVLTIEAPITVRLRETYYLWMDLEIDGKYLAELSLKMIIGMRDGFIVSPPSYNLTAEEGDLLDLELELSSLCYGDMDVMLGVNNTLGNWSIIYRDRSEKLLESVHLSNWSERTIIASVLVPFGAGSGPHLLELKFSGTNGSSVMVMVPVGVQVVTEDGKAPSPGVDIRTGDGDGPLALELEVDDEEDVWVFVRNTGNLRESIRIWVDVSTGEGPGNGWGLELMSIGPEEGEMPTQVQKDLRGQIYVADIAPDEMLLPSGDTVEGLDLNLIMESGSNAWLHLVFKGPARGHLYTVANTFWDIRCDVVGYDVSDHLLIGLEPKYPDLTLSGEVNTTGPRGTVYRSGELLTVSFVIENIGNVPAKDFKVSFWLDEKLTESQDIVLLGFNGTQRLMTFQFRAEPGMHMVRIELDPDNSVIESADQFIDGGKNNNNVHVRTITVHDEKDDDWADDMVMMLFGLTVLVVFLVICVTIYIYLKGRRNGDLPAEE